MTRFRHAPIARLEALGPFSRDHYVGLVQARRLVKAADADDVARRRALSEFLDAWDSDIADHFCDEERLLADLAAPEDRERLFAEHQRLMGLADTAHRLHREVDPDPAILREIGQALEAHIRWEERHLFQRLQNRLSPEQLASLGIQTTAIEQARPRTIDRTQHSEGDGT